KTVAASSSGQSVQVWENQAATGSAFDVSQPGAPARPTFQPGALNGLPIVRFNGTTHWMGAATLDFSAGYTLCMVLKVNTAQLQLLASVYNASSPQTRVQWVLAADGSVI